MFLTLLNSLKAFIFKLLLFVLELFFIFIGLNLQIFKLVTELHFGSIINNSKLNGIIDKDLGISQKMKYRVTFYIVFFNDQNSGD